MARTFSRLRQLSVWHAPICFPYHLSYITVAFIDRTILADNLSQIHPCRVGSSLLPSRLAPQFGCPRVHAMSAQSEKGHKGAFKEYSFGEGSDEGETHGAVR
jgi:hypothetical protein